MIKVVTINQETHYTNRITFSDHVNVEKEAQFIDQNGRSLFINISRIKEITSIVNLNY